MNPAPHDLDAEARLIGALLHDPSKIPAVAADGLTAADFYGVSHANVYAACCDLWTGGHLGGSPDGDLTVIGHELAERGHPVPPADLLGLLSHGYSQVWSLVPIVTGHAVRRRLLTVLAAAVDEARDMTMEPVDVRDRTARDLAAVEVPLGDAVPDSLHPLEDFVAAADAAPAPWVVPGLFRRDWRVVLVAGEGSGKSVLCRQIALTAARGVHPLSGHPMSTGPVRTLLVDLENPAGVIADVSARVTTAVDGLTQVRDEGRAWIWHEPSGVNLRRPADRVRLEAAIAHAQPDLLVIGPGYKLYRKDPGQSDEDAVAEVFAVLDDLRTRYRCALLIEHHAPKGNSAYGPRDMNPHGTVLWQRWPEIGIGAHPGDGEKTAKSSLVFGRWRGDRVANSWPDRVDRGTGLPWVGVWRDGVPRDVDEQQGRAS